MKIRMIFGAVMLLASSGAFASAITVDNANWYEFLFGGVGSYGTACSGGCVPSSGGNSEEAGAAPWTFSGAADFTVTDAFQSGDIFEVFDFGTSLGTTSAPTAGGSCGSDPDACLVDAAYSHGIFSLGGGSHSITIQMVASPFGSGAAYFKASSVPEPATVALFGLGLVGLAASRRRRKTTDGAAA